MKIIHPSFRQAISKLLWFQIIHQQGNFPTITAFCERPVVTRVAVRRSDLDAADGIRRCAGDGNLNVWMLTEGWV